MRSWIRGGKLPATEGQRGKVVRLADVLALAEMTGKLPATGRQTAGNTAAGNETARSAGNDISNAADVPAVADNMRAALEVFRDELVRPFVQDLREAERKIGRLEAERDALRSRLEQIESEQAAAVAANEGAGRVEPRDAAADVWAKSGSFWGRLMRLLGGG